MTIIPPPFAPRFVSQRQMAKGFTAIVRICNPVIIAAGVPVGARYHPGKSCAKNADDPTLGRFCQMRVDFAGRRALGCPIWNQ
jgi:hypothetical protein